jgi:hypothetical protein
MENLQLKRTLYKLININLSKIYEFGQKSNKLTPLEQTKFINYDELLKIRQTLYNDWLDEYENTALTKYKNFKLRIKNIKSLLLLIIYISCLKQL